MRQTLVLILVFAAGSAMASPGQDLFNAQCASCHTLAPVSTADGPSLKGVLYRKIASLDGFDYSTGLKAKIGTWSPDRLDAFLKDPQAFAPGADMFEDLKDPAERKAIIDYLGTVP